MNLSNDWNSHWLITLLKDVNALSVRSNGSKKWTKKMKKMKKVRRKQHEKIIRTNSM